MGVEDLFLLYAGAIRLGWVAADGTVKLYTSHSTPEHRYVDNRHTIHTTGLSTFEEHILYLLHLEPSLFCLNHFLHLPNRP